jgi:hypothetical protein
MCPAGQPQPDLAHRLRRGQRRLAERAVQPQVDVHDPGRAVVVEQVLAVRLRADQHPTVQTGRFGGEPALRAAHRDRGAGEPAPVQPREPVERVPLGHQASGSAGGVPVRS